MTFENNKGDVRTLNTSYIWGGKQLNIAIHKFQKQELNHPSQPIILFDFNVNYRDNYGEKVAIVGELIENFEKTKQFVGGL